MIAYFPKPMPDEAFYSLISRYQKHTLCSSYQWISRELFGLRDITPMVDLPSYLSVFSKKTSSAITLPENQLIKNHTLWPYFQHFIKKEHHGWAIESMETSHDDLRSRLRASNISRAKNPLYCPVCCLEDLKQNGEMYWHRTHQIPSILICPIHDCYLQAAQREDLSLSKKFQFIVASPASCPQTIVINKNGIVLRIAERMKELLNCPDQAQNLKFKKNLLGLKKLYTKNGRLQFSKLKAEFSNFFGHETLQLYQNSQKWNNRKLLTIDVVRRDTTINPLRNIMIEIFIEEKTKVGKAEKTIFKNESIYCENFIAHGAKKINVPLAMVKQSKRKQSLCGHFICHCGMKLLVYKFENQKYSKPIIDDRGVSWKNELKKMLKSGASRNAVSERFKIALNLVDHYKVLFKNEVSKEERKRYSDTDNKLRLKRFRTSWLKAFKTHPKWNIKRTGKDIPYTYIWLLKNDKDWITKINSGRSSNVKKPSTPKFNYLELDTSFLGKIEEAYQKLVSTGYKSRITSALLKRSLQSGITNITTSKFPLTSKFLKKVSEDLKKRDQRLSVALNQ